jgi:ABC-type multidrug transport system fused ATPase/permease subunit
MKYVALIIGSQILSSVFQFFQRRTFLNMSRYIEYDLRQDFYGHLQRLPLQSFQRHRTGDLMARATNDLGAVRQIVCPAIMHIEQTLFRLLISLPLMFQISGKLTLIMLLTMPFVTLTVKYFGHQIHVRFERIQAFLGERGITFSGGQKQRAAIARALIREPQILILDDSLSAVDTYTEEKILSGLRDMMRSRTTLIVAHRISTVKDADLICVLDHGRIVERGSHQELMRIGGAYADLYERQLLEEELAAS